MTKEELKQFDGQDGRKAYVAYQGKIYDVTPSDLWKKGEHEGMHVAGHDLTEAMGQAPHGEEVFQRFNVVGELEEDTAISDEKPPVSSEWKTRLKAWYQRYHPHPITVHFPIALHFFAAGLDLMFLASPDSKLELGVYYAFFVATFMGAVAMIPGILSWWVNYALSTAPAFMIKLYVAMGTLLLGIIGIGLHLSDPMVAFHSGFTSYFYHFAILITVPTVVVLAYYGGKITWPEKRERQNSDLSSPPFNKEKPKLTETPSPSPSAPLSMPLASLDDPPYLPQLQATEAHSHASYQNGTWSFSDLSILIAGPAGSGIQSVEALLVELFKRAGFHIFSTKEYMSRIRGGSNSVLLRIANRPVHAPRWNCDISLSIDAQAHEHIQERISSHTRQLGPFDEAAKQLDGSKYLNSYIAGIVAGLVQLPPQLLQDSIQSKFGKRDPESNQKAASLGYEEGVGRTKSDPLRIISHPKKPPASGLMEGTTACGFGFLAGGCNFVSSYPMSPSTGVLNFMAGKSHDFTILVEQAEDEIAAFNMALGAWYAGGKGLTTTSGGGFALMCESISLSGMTETPMVIYLAQRPGPATGLPTRTEQGDLNLALHAGHGEFPRILLAPGDPQECVELGFLAFETADRYQVPVILLSDQYLADTVQMSQAVDFNAMPKRSYLTETDKDYQRFALTDHGISPRGIPGFGQGLVACDSDEHDERGQITEDYQIRESMVQKRQNKLATIRSETLPPLIVGNGSIAVVGWGSTKPIIAETLATLQDERLFQVHFAWIYPLHPDHLAPLREAKRVIVIENNSDAQFADLLKLHDVKVHQSILQANGFQFFVDQLLERLTQAIKERS